MSPAFHALNRCFLCLLVCCSLEALAAPIPASDIPPPLKPWIPWVLYGEEEKTCTFMHSNIAERQCAWPGTLELEIYELGGTFNETWSLERQAWVTLPGGEDAPWPQEVTVDGTVAAPIMRESRPALLLPAGSHRLQGRYYWQHVPESLPVPPQTGLVKLSINKNRILQPRRAEDGNLWLGSQSTPRTQDTDQDQLDVQVFRRVVDDVPVQVMTRLHLRVAGVQREAVLGPLGVENSTPLRLDSPLPAKLNADNSLRVLLRPGEWDIDYTARLQDDILALKTAKPASPWPTEEVWSYEAHPDLRAATVSGVAAIDPTQSGVPPEWQTLPAYRVTADDTFTLLVERRGDPEPTADTLHLRRSLWLDFDGKGYTVNDTLTGTASKTWRLEAGPELKLGRVTADGQAQLLTATDAQSSITGIEIRQGIVQVTADSRIDDIRSELPASGWRHDLQSLQATLHLPPGWRLLAVTGVDSAPGTWLQRWSLLDFFLVLVSAMAAGKLWGRFVGAIALVMLVLTWHAPGAPGVGWLVVLATIALTQLLPDGRLRRFAAIIMKVSLLGLLLSVVPFVVSQLRTALYPQLETPEVFSGYAPSERMESDQAKLAPQGVEAPAVADVANDEVAASVADAPLEPSSAPTMQSERARNMMPANKIAAPRRKLPEQDLDPDARIQTGPGLPAWQWHRLPFAWHGPVDQHQHVRLYLLPPGINALLNIVRVLLVLLFIKYLFRSPTAIGTSLPPGSLHAFFMAIALLPISPNVAAAIPDAATQEQLRNRLLAPPLCAPLCADINRMRISIKNDRLEARVEINALAATAVPLPGHAAEWVPAEVLLDGVPAYLIRKDDGSLWAKLTPGHHELQLSGSLGAFNNVSFPLPLSPHSVQVSASGWKVEGLHEDGSSESQLQFSRAATAVGTDLTKPDMGASPGFAKVERTLHLGLNWHITTQVQKLSPETTAISMEVPLLSGESLLTPGLQVKSNRVLVTLEPGSSQLSWESALNKSDTVTLEAPTTGAFVEVWRLDASSMWHVVWDGLAPTQPLAHNDRRIPQWRPWPGEKLLLRVSRPPAVVGPTMTIDASQLRITPGDHFTDSELHVRLRSSQGGSHRLRLPSGAELQNVEINGQLRSLRLQGDNLTLPVVPGMQDIRLSWRENRGIAAWYATSLVGLGAPSVNHTIELLPGADRWPLFLGGPRLGPAVLFWGLLLAVSVFAAALGRLSLTPLKTRHWLLLGIGLTQTSVPAALLIVGWLLALGARGRMTSAMESKRFNLMQIVLVILTLAALTALFESVEHGLLGVPDMQISGNNSSATQLRWYQDRCAEQPLGGWLLSVPFIVYRLLMLLWALWLAAALLGWLRWGWGCFSAGTLWQPLHWQRATPTAQNEPPSSP